MSFSLSSRVRGHAEVLAVGEPRRALQLADKEPGQLQGGAASSSVLTPRSGSGP